MIAEPVHDRDELRLALALNGGVSLAVWMGGAMQELDNVRCAADPPAEEPPDSEEMTRSRAVYEQILEALNVCIRVDIAAATSAGGMNGPLLAAAVAKGNRVTGLRDLWMELADFESLLRNPGDPEPPSLLDGDGYVFEHVKDQLARQFAAPPDRDVRRFRLILTGTDIQGVKIKSIEDSYGAELPRAEHRLQFRFATPEGDAPPRGWLALDESSCTQLARAARTSSSFPFAFEPSRITGGDFAGGLWTRRGGPFAIGDKAHRWAIDGGVLDNSPIQPVLNEIWDTPTAEGPQRRCIVFVTPYSTETITEVPPDAPLSSVLGATFNVPRDVPYVDDLARLAEQVREQRQLDQGDASLLSLSQSALCDLAGAVAEPFKRYRVMRALQTSAGRAGTAVTDDLLEAWAAQPIVERSIWSVMTAEALSSKKLPEPEDWHWGGEHVRSAALRWRVRLAAARQSLPPGAVDARESLRAKEFEIQRAIKRARKAESDARAEAERLEDETVLARMHTRTAGLGPPRPNEPPVPLLIELGTGYEAYGGTSVLAVDHRAEWRKAIETLARVIAGARAEMAGNPRYPAAAEALLGDLSVTPQRLLQAEAILQTLGSPLNADSHPGVEVKFLRLSTSPLTELKADPPSSFTYLYGAQLGHFAGFVRRSWRAHDWLVGRLDGASAIMLLLLNRSRIAESGLSNRRLHELLTEATQASLASPSAHAGAQVPVPRGARITDDLPTESELEAWRGAFLDLIRSRILFEELHRLRALVSDERDRDWSKSTPMPAEPTGQANASVVFAEYVEAIEAAGGTRDVVSAEFSSPKGSRLIADASVVSSNVLGSRTTGFPAFVGAAAGSARGAIRAASFAVHRATGGRLERSLFIAAAGVAGAGLAWAVARGSANGSGPATGGSAFKETVVAASLVILIVAIVLAMRPFARRWMSILYGIATAAALMLLVGWLWTGKVQATCETGTPCGTLGATSFLWLVIGIVALSISVGWIATVTLRTIPDWLISGAAVAFALVLALALRDPDNWASRFGRWVRDLPVIHFISENSAWFFFPAAAILFGTLIAYPHLTAAMRWVQRQLFEPQA